MADPSWRAHLAELAEAADARRQRLARETAEQAPRWAVDALGAVPEDEIGHDEWTERVAAIAAHRELVGYDDPERGLPGPPQPGQVEAYASWRAAWRSLGRDKASRAEAEMSDGQLRVRVRAYAREQSWAPDNVAPRLSGTLQAASRHRATAQLRAAEADVAQEQAVREQLQRDAADAQALATRTGIA